MQDGADRDKAEEAAAELRRMFAGDPEPKINISWRSEDSCPVAYRRILEILFAPRPGEDRAA